jgi:hypothetical protein
LTQNSCATKPGFSFHILFWSKIGKLQKHVPCHQLWKKLQVHSSGNNLKSATYSFATQQVVQSFLAYMLPRWHIFHLL